MSNSLEWLPPDLYPVALRIARADECAYAIGKLAGTWSFYALQQLYDAGMPRLQMGEHFGVSRATVFRVADPAVS